MKNASTTTAPEVRPGLNGAFMNDGFGPEQAERLATLHGAAPGPLSGFRLAVKDVYEITGLPMGAGSPLWRSDQREAVACAPAVAALLGAGATWVGKTVTDELTYSLAGINAHYGKPVNPAAPDRLSGGSSSGSAVAVAAGFADLALGTDCGGSTRLPASYCGIWGMRPTHGRLPTGGCFTLAHSFDTVGWFASTGKLMTAAFEALASTRVTGAGSRRLLVADDATALLDAPVREAFLALIDRLPPEWEIEHLPANTLALKEWVDAFRTLQASEVWQQLGAWVTRRGPQLGEDIGQRFEAASQVHPEAVAAAQNVRIRATETLAGLLRDGRLLAWPTVPTPAPLNDAPLAEVNDIRARSQHTLCAAGLAGLPQVSMPWLQIRGSPVGLSLLGARGADENVLATAQALSARLQPGQS
ncbi:MAG: amidase [Pigmentiphaga sp.]